MRRRRGVAALRRARPRFQQSVNSGLAPLLLDGATHVVRPQPSLRAKRSHPRIGARPGLLRRCAPRNDGVGGRRRRRRKRRACRTSTSSRQSRRAERALLAVADGSLVCGFVAVDPGDRSAVLGDRPAAAAARAAQDGTDATRRDAPAGAAGIRGWLSVSTSISARPARPRARPIPARATSTRCCSASPAADVADRFEPRSHRVAARDRPRRAWRGRLRHRHRLVRAQRADAALAQRLTSILTALGSPMQATGGTIAPLAVAPPTAAERSRPAARRRPPRRRILRARVC